MIEEIEEGEMPTPGYVMMHPATDLTDENLLVLKAWAFAVQTYLKIKLTHY